MSRQVKQLTANPASPDQRQNANPAVAGQLQSV
jgi:hypothetical protein